MKKEASTYFHQQEIIRAIQDGDSESYKKLFLLYYERLCRFAYSYVKSKIIAEDLVQEVFVKIWERREQLKVDKNLQSYLYKAVKNEALDFVNHQDMVSRKLSMLKIDMYPEISDQFLEKLDYSKFITHIQNLIEQLPDKTKQIYKLNKQDGLSYEEIADVLDVSVKTIEYHISKTFQYIRNSAKYDLKSFHK